MSSAPWSSEHTKIRGLKLNLKKELEAARLENSIRKQKMDILGLEIAEILRNFEKSLKGIEERSRTAERLSAGNRMATRILKEQMKEIQKLRDAENQNQKIEIQKTCEAEHIMKYAMEQRKMQPSAK